MLRGFNFSKHVFLSTLVYAQFKCLHFSHSSILEFVKGEYNQAVAPDITKPLHAPGTRIIWVAGTTN